MWHMEGMLERAVDPRIVGQYEVGWLKEFGEVVEKC